MISTYHVRCECGFCQEVFYGKSDEEIMEVYSCPNCKRFVSVNSKDELKCECGNKDLSRYVPNKKADISFYLKMHERGKIDKEQLKEILEFWEHVFDKKCPKCGNDNLKWEIDQ